MATTFVDYDKQTDVGRNITRGIQLVREGRDVLRDVLAVMLTMIDGDGSSATHFTRLKTEAGYESDAVAKASWDELNSLYSKLITPAGQQASDVGPAITQACARHGV